MSPKYVYTVILWLVGAFQCTNTEKVPVIDFKTDGQSFNTIEKRLINENELEATDVISVCFKTMPRYRRDFVIIKMEQFKLTLRFFNGTTFVNVAFQPLNRSHLYAFSRFLQVCQPYLPGKWHSICFCIKFVEKKQHVKFFWNGKLCHHKEFQIDDNFIFYYHKNSTNITDM